MRCSACDSGPHKLKRQLWRGKLGAPRSGPGQLGIGCTAQKLAKLTWAKRRKFQKKWTEDCKYGRRRLVEIVIFAFKEVLGE